MSEKQSPILDAHLDLLVHQMKWADDIPEEARMLVIGNARAAITRLVEDGVLIPADEIDGRVREIASIVEGMKAARSESEDTQPKATHTQEDVDALVKAGQGALALFRRPGEGDIEHFDRKAMQFYSETGIWPPGKSAPMHIEECDDARERFQAWQGQKVDALDAALAPFQKG